MLELDELEVEKREGLELEVMVLLEHEERKLEDEVDEMVEQINLMDEMEVVLMDMVEVDDGGDEMVVNEIDLLMMINEVDEEVVMFFLLLRIGY